jgi:DNA polymerase III subunit beta
MTTTTLEKPATAAKPITKKSSPRNPQNSVQVNAALLAEALKLAERLIERRSGIPILGHVLIDVTRAGLILRTTDLDHWFEQIIPLDTPSAEVTPFRCTTNAKQLGQIVALLAKESSITLAQGESCLNLSAGVSYGNGWLGGGPSYQLLTLNADDFPLTVLPDGVAFEIDAFHLDAMISAVSHAISTEETRYYLNGIFLHNLSGKFTAAATDGHRLAVWAMDMPEGAQHMSGMIIPRKGCKMIAAILARLPGTTLVGVRANARKIAFDFGDQTLICKLIDGTYPDYGRVIPKHNPNRIKINPRHFAKALRRVMAVSSDNQSPLILQFEKDEVTLSAFAPDYGASHERVLCTFLEGAQPVRIGFKPIYLLNILENLQSEECSVDLADPAAPTLFKASDEARAFYVLMPTRV